MEHLIGMLAAFCTTISFIPQAIKVIRTRDTSGISLSMYIIFSIGVALWLVYGILLANPSLIYANTVTLILALIIIYVKITSS